MDDNPDTMVDPEAPPVNPDAPAEIYVDDTPPDAPTVNTESQEHVSFPDIQTAGSDQVGGGFTVDDFNVGAVADQVGDITINGPSPSANVPSDGTTAAADPGLDHTDAASDFLNAVENGFNTTGALVAKVNDTATKAKETIKTVQGTIRPASNQVATHPLPANQQAGGWPFTPLQTILGGVLAVALVIIIKRAK